MSKNRRARKDEAAYESPDETEAAEGRIHGAIEDARQALAKEKIRATKPADREVLRSSLHVLVETRRSLEAAHRAVRQSTVALKMALRKMDDSRLK